VTLERGIELAGTVVEAAGVAILFVGVFAVMASAAYEAVRRQDGRALYGRTRRRLGRVLLLGLEVLVAGDVISTVAVTPTLTSVAVLGGIVLIRTFLSWSIEMETEGRLPWRQRTEPPGA
jgi:uncharacterized membrane protein